MWIQAQPSMSLPAKVTRTETSYSWFTYANKGVSHMFDTVIACSGLQREYQQSIYLFYEI